MRTPGYLVMADGSLWNATSITTGDVASDACPIRALTECRGKERGTQQAEAAQPVKKGPPAGVPKQPIDVALAMAMTFLRLDMRDISGPERFPAIVRRRSIAWYLLWNHGNGLERVFSSLQVTDACRRSNHSTIMTACHRVLPLTLRPEWKQLLAAWERCVRYGEVKDCTNEPWFISLMGVMGGAA
jgi:hypothetical protein